MNIPKTLIVMGRSGSGKGTQINLLKESYGQESRDDSAIFHFEPGNIFRSMAKTGNYSSKKIKETIEQGNLVPNFITNGLFVESLVSNITSDEQLLIFDGYPRSINQAEMLDNMLKFYNRAGAVVVHVKVSEEEIRNRLIERGRSDDGDDAMETRIKFYNECVLPTIQWYEEHSDYTVLTINGEGAIEDIQKEIFEKLTHCHG